MADPYRGGDTERWDFEPPPRRRRPGAWWVLLPAMLSWSGVFWWRFWERDMLGAVVAVGVSVVCAAVAVAVFVVRELRRG